MTATKQIYAHSIRGRPSTDWETLEAHSQRVMEAARSRAEPFGAGNLAAALGLLHDLGKVKQGFQKKLMGAVNDTSHSGEGAKVLAEMGVFEEALSVAIAGHHGRLPDPDLLISAEK